jgi:propanol-preferring alcohol dehydrogenase
LGAADEKPPVPLDAAIMFAPAGELVPPALRALKKGGRLILIYQERLMRSVANNTRDDGREFLRIAAEIPVHISVETFPPAEANHALQVLRDDGVRGAAVLLNQ